MPLLQKSGLSCLECKENKATKNAHNITIISTFLIAFLNVPLRFINCLLLIVLFMR